MYAIFGQFSPQLYIFQEKIDLNSKISFIIKSTSIYNLKFQFIWMGIIYPQICISYF